ncbi:MoaD/ThiS family protein [Micromonospora sp. NPDC003776]
MVKIVLPSGWAHRGRTEFEARQGPLVEVIKEFAARHPTFRRRLLDGEGELLRYYSIYLDDDAVPRHERVITEVPDGSTVTIIPPMAGG